VCNHFPPFARAGPIYDGRLSHYNKRGNEIRERNMVVPQKIVQLYLFKRRQNTEIGFYVYAPCIVKQLRNVNQWNAHFSN